MAEETWKDYRETKHYKPQPLKGIRVVHVTTLLFGPSGPEFLSELGAESIKVEMPPLGDTARVLAPFSWFFRGQGTMFTSLGTNQYWTGIDLHKPEGVQIFKELVARSDIVEENLRPGVMEGWGIGYRQLKEVKPDIIYIAKNGFGQWGQYAEEDRPSNDGAAQALAGFSWMSSFPGQAPLKHVLWLADYHGGLIGEVAVLSALEYRERTGKGQFIEMSQAENLMRTMPWVWPYQHITGKGAMPEGNRDQAICPADTFRCIDDSFVSIAAAAPEEFKGLCTVMGQPELAEDPRFKDHLTRLKDENAREILKVIAQWARTKTPKDIEGLALEYGFAASRVCNVKDFVEDAWHTERGYLTELDDPLYGVYTDHDFPVMMSKTPPRQKWPPRAVGFDNDYVMTSVLGKTKSEIEHLYEVGALGKWKDVLGRKPPADWDGKAGLLLSR